MNNKTKNKADSRRKLKYASLSVSFAVVFIALIIGLNAFVTVISKSVTMKIDLTGEDANFYTVSSASDEALASLGDDWKVTLYFLAEKDDISDLRIAELAEEYSRRYSGHVTVEYKDINRDTAFVQKYKDETQTNITTKHLIVQGEHHARVLSFSSFYLTDESNNYEVFAFQGELRITSAILQAGIETAPLAVFTTGHGETIDSLITTDFLADYNENDIASLASNVGLVSLLVDAGYEIGTVDLSTEEIPEEARLLIISEPKYDFLGFDSKNPNAVSEIDKIVNFVNAHNTLYVALNDSTPHLPNLAEYLNEKGIGYESNVQVFDMDNSIVGTNGLKLLGKVGNFVSSSTLGYRLTEDLPSSARLVFPNAVKLTADTSVYGTEAVITTYPSATADGKNELFPLLAINCQADIEGNAYLYDNVVVSASTDFASSPYVNTSFANRQLIQAILRVSNTTQVSPDIPYKELTSEALTLTSEQARTWTIVVTCVAPIIIFGIAAIIWVKRRNA